MQKKLSNYLTLYIFLISVVSLLSFYWVYANFGDVLDAYSQSQTEQEHLALTLSREVFKSIDVKHIKIDSASIVLEKHDYNLITELFYIENNHIFLRKGNHFFRYTGKYKEKLKQLFFLKTKYLSNQSRNLYRPAFIIFVLIMTIILSIGIALIFFLSRRIKRNMTELKKSLANESIPAKIDFVEFSLILNEFRKYQAKSIQIERQNIIQDVLSRWQMEVKKIIHDLRNPLQRIKLTLNNIEKFSQTELALAAVDEIQLNLKNIRSAELIDEINPTIFDLNQFFERIKTLFYEIEIKFVSTLIEGFKFDEYAFQRICSNFIQNSIDANAMQIHFSFFTENEKTIIEISNNGNKIEYPEKLFIPFSTSKKNGSGLGLVIVLQFLHMHNGTMFLKNTTSTESTFRIELI